MTRADKDTLRTIMSKKVRTLAPDRPTKDALKLMVKLDLGSIVVVKDSRVVGIVTERDLVTKIMSPRVDLDKPLSKIASKPVVTATPDTKVWEAFGLMLKGKFRRLPVVEAGKLVGIVTERDLFKWVVGVIYEPNIPEDLAVLIAKSS